MHCPEESVISTRDRVIQQIAERIQATAGPHTVRVAVDGVDAAGKTTLANELVGPLEERGRPVIRASIDSFHRPRVERYRQGDMSPRGYYEDTFDYDRVCSDLLRPLGPGGSGLFRAAAFDYAADRPVEAPVQEAEPRSVLLCDGVFLLRSDLVECWDFRIVVHVSFEEALRRGVERDAKLPGSADAARDRYERRYLAGQRIYMDVVKPMDRADLIVYNEDPAAPRLVIPSRPPSVRRLRDARYTDA